MESDNSDQEETVQKEEAQAGSSKDGGKTVFDFDWNWKPAESPAGLQFLSLLPVTSTALTGQYGQEEPTLKVSTAKTHRRQRLKIISCGRTNCKNIRDQKRLCAAANLNDYIAAVELLDGGADPSCSDEKQRTPLHFAASQGFETIAKNDTESCSDEKQRTLLHFAASQGTETIVKLLLDRGANPNKKDFIGNTPLHLAACTCQVPIVTLLLKAGTDIKSVDQYGRTPLTLAKSRLKMLSQESSSNSEKLRGEIIQISEMMKTYLELSGCRDDADQLESLCLQLECSTSLAEVNQVNSMLSDFASMSIEKKAS